MWKLFCINRGDKLIDLDCNEYCYNHLKKDGISSLVLIAIFRLNLHLNYRESVDLPPHIPLFISHCSHIAKLADSGAHHGALSRNFIYVSVPFVAYANYEGFLIINYGIDHPTYILHI